MLISAITIAVTTWIVSVLRGESVSRAQRIGLPVLSCVMLALVVFGVTRVML